MFFSLSMYKKKSKFGVNTTKKGISKRTFEGIVFDSEMELKYYRDYLLPLKAQGMVKSITLQPIYLLQSKFVKNNKVYLPIKYVSDFEVEYTSGEIITVDVKGLPSPESKIKKKLFLYKYPDKELLWTTYSRQDGGWIEYDALCKLRSKRKRESKSKS
jgi:hypothetical protein